WAAARNASCCLRSWMNTQLPTHPGSLDVPLPAGSSPARSRGGPVPACGAMMRRCRARSLCLGRQKQSTKKGILLLGLHLSRQTATLLAAVVVAGAAAVAGLVLLLGPVDAPIGPFSGPDGYISQIS